MGNSNSASLKWFLLYFCAALSLWWAYGAGPHRALAQDRVTLQGTGATFPRRSTKDGSANTTNCTVRFRSIIRRWGSGAGIKQFQQGLVDFGASDAAMTDQEMAAVKRGVVLLPMMAGAVVLAYNLPDFPGTLKLSRAAYSGIFLGKLSQWNDPEIAKTNPGTKLPDKKITVVSRSDGSGTTFVFTSHLSAISDVWKGGPGAGKTVNFPVGVAGKGNPGVAALIKQTPGAIGYVEYGYAEQTHMPMATLENKSGKFVQANIQSEQAALNSVELPANLRAWITDPSSARGLPDRHLHLAAPL